jgi:hypothetical protein
VSLLSLYYETSKYGKGYPKPALELINGELEWEVSEILASWRHGRQHKLQYLVS